MKKGFTMTIIGLFLILWCGGCAGAIMQNPVDTTLPVEQWGEREISVATCFKNEDNYHSYISNKANRFMSDYPNITININCFDDIDDYTAYITTGFMSGKVDDLFDPLPMDLVTLSANNLVVDLNTFIDMDPDFNEETYFMNILEGLEIRGGLYSLPNSFSVHTVGINTTLPDSDAMLADWIARETVTFYDLMDVYAQCAPYGIYTGHNMDLNYIAPFVIESRIDFDNKTCNFNDPVFIQFLQDVKQSTNPYKPKGYPYLFHDRQSYILGIKNF